jgi:aminopeptidase 2
MISTHLGMDTFMEGMRLYLSRHAYGNAVTNDLWRALEEASGFPVVKFMKPWTLEVGYPILLLSDDGSMAATRFLGSGPERRIDSLAIPVTAGLKDLRDPSEWTDESKQKAAERKACGMVGLGNGSFNINQTAFFRTAYTG